MTKKQSDAVRRLIEEAWNQGTLAVVDALYVEGALSHANGPTRPSVSGAEQIKETIASVREAFGEFHIAIEDLFAAKDRVVCRWRAEGVQRREVLGVPPTGRHVTWGGISLFAFAEGEGRIREEWWAYDEMCVFREITAGPTARAAGA